jgi:uncharacterized membrane protein
MDPQIIDVTARFLHVAGVITWVGHNWSNVVHMPRYKGTLPEDPPAAKAAVFLAASKREHGIFRYASLVVLATGAFMLWRRDELVEAVTLSGPYALLGIGVWIGLAMVLNLWLVLWPHQKKVLGFAPAPVEERLRCTRITFMSSRVNTVLSFATIFCMVAGSHAAILL